MTTLFDQILSLVGQPPGSLVYHFIILFAVEAAFAISLGQWMRERTSGTLRLTAASFALFLARVVLLLASLAAWQGYFPRNVLLPPVERLVDTVTVLGLAWAFVTMDEPDFRKRNFVADVAAAVTLGVSLILFAGTYYFWTSASASNTLFNGSWLDTVWGGLQILIALAGLVWMLTRIRYAYDPFLKGLVLILLGAAAALHLLRPSLGDISAAMRLGQLVAIPMLAAVAYRHVVEQLLRWDDFEPSRLASAVPATSAVDALPPPGMAEETARAEPSVPAAPAEAETPSVAAPHITPTLLETLESVGSLLSTLEADEIVEEAPRAVATALRADVCALALVDEDVQQLTIVGAYDNISQTSLHRDVLRLAEHPTFVNALGRLRQMRLTMQRNAAELRDVYRKMRITHEGPAYVQPLVNKDERVGVLFVGSPYSERQFSDDERNLLDRLGPLVTAALLNAEAFREMQDKAERAVAHEAGRIVELADDVRAKSAELNMARRQIEEMKEYIRDMHTRLEEVPARQQAAQAEIESLQARIERLQARAAEAEKLRAELAEARSMAPAPGEQELAALRSRLAQARVTEQEVSLLQEQLADRVKEVVRLRSRLAEVEAEAETLREKFASAGGQP